MRELNILVTGVGAIIGYGIIRSLREGAFTCRIIGTDIYPDAVGKVWCDMFIQSPPASSEHYCLFLSQILRTQKIDLVLFGTEQEIYKIHKNRRFFSEDICKLVLNNSLSLELGSDKWKTNQFLLNNGIQCIKSSLDKNFESLKEQLGLPILLKPRCSYASKGIHYINTPEDFQFWSTKMDKQFLAQEVIGDSDHEYTVGVFGLGNGNCLPPIIFRRKLSQEGATSKAIVENNSALENEAHRLCKLFKPIGPTNFQFRKQNGTYFLLEINPRISSSTSIRTKFGYNEADMCIQFYVDGKVPIVKKIRKGFAIRYIDEVIEYL